MIILTTDEIKILRGLTETAIIKIQNTISCFDSNNALALDELTEMLATLTVYQNLRDSLTKILRDE